MPAKKPVSRINDMLKELFSLTEGNAGLTLCSLIGDDIEAYWDGLEIKTTYPPIPKIFFDVEAARKRMQILRMVFPREASRWQAHFWIKQGYETNDEVKALIRRIKDKMPYNMKRRRKTVS